MHLFISRIFFYQTWSTLYQIWHESTTPTNFQPQMNISHAPTRSFSRPLINSEFILKMKSKYKIFTSKPRNCWWKFEKSYRFFNQKCTFNLELLKLAILVSAKVSSDFTWNQFLSFWIVKNWYLDKFIGAKLQFC